MADTFRLDLEGFDRDYVLEVLDGFFEKAANYGREMIELRMSQKMLDLLAIEPATDGVFFRGVPIIVADTGFEGTVEVILARPQ